MLLPLLVGTGMLLASLLSYAVATALIVQVVVRLIRSGYTDRGFWKNVVAMMIDGLSSRATS